MIIYHLKFKTNFNNFKRFNIEFIMFLNRMFISTKKRYWFIKLKIIDLMWIIKRVRHFIEIFRYFIVVFIDHVVNINIVKQITFSFNNIDKLNLRLIKTSIYFF